MSTYPDNLKQMVPVDNESWSKNLAEGEERFRQWILQ